MFRADLLKRHCVLSTQPIESSIECRRKSRADCNAPLADLLYAPFQVTEGAKTLGWSLRKYLTALKEAGLGSLPGTAAEVLDDETRAIICPDKLNTAQWLEVR